MPGLTWATRMWRAGAKSVGSERWSEASAVALSEACGGCCLADSPFAGAAAANVAHGRHAQATAKPSRASFFDNFIRDSRITPKAQDNAGGKPKRNPRTL